MEILGERTNDQGVSNPGAIYPLLTLIEHEGFIAGEWADPAKRSVRIYNITEAGRAELERSKTIVTPKIEETVNVLQDLKSQPSAKLAPSTEPDSTDLKSEA
jgi:DNA-binding PadR family transcriptional regulator